MPLTHKHMDALFVIDLCELYMDYMDDIKSAKDKCYITENLLKALRHYCEEVNPKFPVGWMVLYCVYKKHDYRPGMNYTRWKYENLTDQLFTDIIRIPKSRWEIFNNFQPSLKTERGKYFWQACEFLLKLGLYYFARWLFDDIINELKKVEIYIVDASLQLAEKLIPPVFAPERPSLEESEKSIFPKANELNAFVYLVNGNIEYYRDPDDLNAMKHYGSLLHIKGVGKDPRFELGILRYAYRMLEEKQLEEALKAFQFARSGDHRVIGYVGKAKALYFLDRLEEAEIYFAKSTRFYMHLPNVWAYLAVINLRLGQNYKALECWKYARLDPDVIFDDEILNELEKLDIETLFFVNA
uniref:Tetratricopeptide repeat protein n=1 Tax=Glossina morsitans morsitans TaxID=37546 RepID=A0A1B0FP34_GLOMM